MNKGDLKIIIKDIIKEVLDIDTQHDSEEMADVHKSKLIKSLDNFTISYINGALFTSTDNLEPHGGQPLDKKYDINDIEIETLIKMAKDCKEFQDNYSELYFNAGWNDEEAGFDFWLTRNGHGSGFWDKGYKDEEKERAGKELTKAAKNYGEYNLFLCDGKYEGLICGG